MVGYRPTISLIRHMGGLNRPICPNPGYRWTVIRPYAKLGDMGGWLSAHIAV
jgi:hypothetical protein